MMVRIREEEKDFFKGKQKVAGTIREKIQL